MPIENRYLVRAEGEHVYVPRAPELLTGRIAKREALELAVWLIVASGASEDDLLDALEEVQKPANQPDGSSGSASSR